MSSLIERQAALGALGERPVVWSDNDDYTLGARNQYDMDRLALETVPSAQRWIPCSEKLPYAEYGESDTVLTTCGYRDVEDTSVRWIRLLYFNGGNWCYPTGETYEAKVYAWCPLPEPWKGERDG